MYIDKEMVLDFDMPEQLREYIAMAEEAFYEKDEGKFDDAMEMVEVVAKSCALDGRISYPDMSKIRKKYGGWG